MSLHSIEDQQSSLSRALQVINSVNCVIRELVENSIDANSTKIEIKVYNGGIDMIQVSDNGTGIAESNFEVLASKHTTSKIRQFEDLFSSLTTFGFRGEALYSLCNVGTVEIETRVAPSEHGWQLKYDSSGELTSKTPVATHFGTSVRVRDLFKNYSVRRKLLLKTSKNQISKAVSQLQQYALINPKIAFTFTTVSGTNQFSNIFTTSGNHATVRGVVEQIFGYDFSSKLIDIRVADNTWKIEGLISSPYIERSCRDLEYFYINMRPITKIHKFKNSIFSVFKHFSSKSRPSFILNLTIDYDNVDINLSPDKRSAFLFSEDYIVRSFKEALYDILIPKNSTLSQINSEILTNFLSQPDGKCFVKTEKKDESPEKPKETEVEKEPAVLKEMEKMMMPEVSWNYEKTEEEQSWEQDTSRGSAFKMEDLGEFEYTSQPNRTPEKEALREQYVVDKQVEIEEYNYRADGVDSYPVEKRGLTMEDLNSPKRLYMERREENVNNVVGTSGVETTREMTMETQEAEEGTGTSTRRSIYTLQDFLDTCPQEDSSGDCEFLEITEHGLYANTKPIFYQTSPQDQLDTSDLNRDDMEDHNFLDPRVFENMKLVGQFNNSFIITKLTFPEVRSKYNYSIYIIDQHAADEKYRFENLNRTVKIDKQVLINPKLVELSPFLTQVAEQHLDLLISNGFDTTVCKESEVVIYRDRDITMSADTNQQMSKGVYLHSFPQVLGKVLEEEDFVDFVNQLSGSEQLENRDDNEVVWGRGAIQRPQKVWSILANRACKSAIKLGDPLSKGQMKNIIGNLSTLIHPWNCPHGRPSMKCLISHQQLDTLFNRTL